MPEDMQELSRGLSILKRQRLVLGMQWVSGQQEKKCLVKLFNLPMTVSAALRSPFLIKIASERVFTSYLYEVICTNSSHSFAQWEGGGCSGIYLFFCSI